MRQIVLKCNRKLVLEGNNYYYNPVKSGNLFNYLSQETHVNVTDLVK